MSEILKKNLKKLADAGVYNTADEHDACGVGFVASIDGKPRKGFDDLLVRFFAVALLVGIFNSEDKCTASVTSISPVEQSGAH